MRVAINGIDAAGKTTATGANFGTTAINSAQFVNSNLTNADLRNACGVVCNTPPTTVCPVFPPN